MKPIKNAKYALLFLCFFSTTILQAQNENFAVKRTSFSSLATDEFSPVSYKDGLVFCSNRSDNSIIGYSENQKGLFKIFYVKKTSSGWKQPGILAPDLTTLFNDGPVTFNAPGNIAYFSRNNRVENVFGDVNDTTNKLGIFCAELNGEKWTNIAPFPFSDPRFNYSTPGLSPDDTRLYFSSDKPGGYGGMDLYYSEKKDGKWGEPENLGPMINTSHSETFPFAAPDGKLFFSSDGHAGCGGKDIYYTQQIGEMWVSPVHLDSAINSIADDFGLITDSAFEQGYFSSNRMKTDDIFSFHILQPQFARCDTIKENNYCFTFFDERQQLIDTVPVIYNWDFGDGIIRKGKEVKFCFPGNGEYTVKLTIIDAIAGKAIADKVEYKVNLENISQAYINSDNIGLVNQPVSFQGITSGLNDFTAKAYFWNFGDGFRPGMPYESKVFAKKGEYTVQLGLWGQKDSTGIIPEACYQKIVRIFNSFEEISLPSKNEGDLQIKALLMDDLSENQKQNLKKIFILKGDPGITGLPGQFSEEDDPMLGKIASILLTDQDIKLETVVIPQQGSEADSLASEKLKQQLAFYFRGKTLNDNSFHCTTGNLRLSEVKTSQMVNKSGEMTVEFIFMKNIDLLHD
jgi:hypothetical protein